MSNSKNRRGRLLLSVGSAITVAMAAGAQGAEIRVVPDLLEPSDLDTSVEGQHVIDDVLINPASVTAAIAETQGGVGEEASPTGTSTITVDGNDLHAIAIGNNFANTITPFAINANPISDGAAALGVAMNGFGGAILSHVYNNEISADLDDFQNGSAGVNGNRIDSDATGNAGTTRLSGPIPAGFTSDVAGSADLAWDGPADWLNAAGTLVAGTVQFQAYSQVQADAASDNGNDIFLDLISTGDNTVVGNPQVTGNSIASNGKGNSANSTIDIQSGEAPVFTGSAVIANGQLNVDDLGFAFVNASTSGAIYANIRADDIFSAVNTLAGSLTLSGNTISANAAGNEVLGKGVAGNRIILGDGLSFAGNGLDGAAVDLEYDALTGTMSAQADLAILNSQGNVGIDGSTPMQITGNNSGATILALVQAIDGGSVTVADNAVIANAIGNIASSEFQTGSGAASFTGSVAVANQQNNTYVEVSAAVSDPLIQAEVTYEEGPSIPDSSVKVDGNRIAATAYGNQTSNSASLEAAALSLTLGSVALTGGTGPDGNLHADGGAVVTNLQSLYNSTIIGREHQAVTKIEVRTDDVFGSSLAVTGNTQEVLAIGNTGANNLALASATGSTGAGVASVQIVDQSAVTAIAGGVRVLSTSRITNTTAETSGNLQRAIAYGASVGNTLSVEAETLAVDGAIDGVGSQVYFNDPAPSGFVFDNDPAVAPRVEAAYGVLNVQSVSGATSAKTTSEFGSAMIVTVSGATGSSVVNEDNAIVGAAYGTAATNKASLDVGNLGTSDDGFATVLQLTNAQTVTEGASVYAEASGASAVYTNVSTYDTTDSSVSTQNNLLQALAYGNLVNNAVAVTATNIDTEADSFPAGTRGEAFAGGTSFADASFGLTNAQSAGGAIIATQNVSIDDQVAAAQMLTNLGGSIIDSSVVSAGNTLSAGATGNRADNSVDVSGNDLATTAALANFQHSAADISSQIGFEGVDGPNAGGVSVAVFQGVDRSTVSVDENTIAGSVTGNSATNAVKGSGTNIADGSDHFATWGITTATDTTALGDYMLSSLQLVRERELTNTVYSTLSIDLDLAENQDVTGSTLTIDGNSQSARTVANTVSNSVELKGTNIAAGAALVSNQESWATANATSDLDIFAPVSSTGSSVSLSDNANLALTVLNNAANTLTVAAANVDPVTFARDAVLDIDSNAVVRADHILLNQQVATTSATANAVTSIYNEDNLTSGGILGGSVTVAGNRTRAEASANRAVNSADLRAGASLGASAGVTNSQISSAEVNASATTFAGIGVMRDDQDDAGALNASSIRLGENTTTALAHGNSAANVLNYAAGADYGVDSVSGAGSTIAVGGGAMDAVVNARAAVLNGQVNTGAVTAGSVNASYLVALNTGGDTPALTNGTIGVIGNSVSATAYGNTAANALTVATRSGTAPSAAIGNGQFNSGAITATVTTVAYGVTSGLGSVSGGALSVTGNAITATAVGNNVNTVISAVR